jgi:hypothetical protein
MAASDLRFDGERPISVDREQSNRRIKSCHELSGLRPSRGVERADNETWVREFLDRLLTRSVVMALLAA